MLPSIWHRSCHSKAKASNKTAKAKCKTRTVSTLPLPSVGCLNPYQTQRRLKFVAWPGQFAQKKLVNCLSLSMLGEKGDVLENCQRTKNRRIRKLFIEMVQIPGVRKKTTMTTERTTIWRCLPLKMMIFHCHVHLEISGCVDLWPFSGHKSSSLRKCWIQVWVLYLWWKKSCTTWDVENPVNNGMNYLSSGAGFLPSTVPLEHKAILTSPFLLP